MNYRIIVNKNSKVFLKETPHTFQSLTVHDNGDCEINTITKKTNPAHVLQFDKLESITEDEWNAAWEVVMSHK